LYKIVIIFRLYQGYKVYVLVLRLVLAVNFLQISSAKFSFALVDFLILLTLQSYGFFVSSSKFFLLTFR
jgi:hypothetical protein